jgi:hypothetical protein
MGAPDTPKYFYVHTLGPGPDGAVNLMKPERIEV